MLSIESIKVSVLIPQNKFHRLFIAIPLSDEYISFLNSFRGANKNIKNVRWTKSENLHLTLCFIGHVDESKIEEIISVIVDLSHSTNSFRLDFKENRYAPKKSHPTMIWAEFRQNNDFANLYHSLHENLATYLIKKENRKDPIPHITLARLKGFSKEPLVQNEKLPAILTVNKIELWESRLRPTGSEYISIKSFALS